MIPVLFKLGPITVYSYGVMMALGFLAADFVISSECRQGSDCLACSAVHCAELCAVPTAVSSR
jgi:prolipoprotein diacylglyceryltransferase